MPSPAIPPPRTSCASSSPDHPQTLRPAARRFCFPPPSAYFRWRRLRRRRVSKDSPPGESLRLAVPVPPPAIPSPYPFPTSPSPPHSLAALRDAAYPKDSPPGESPRSAVPVPPPAILLPMPAISPPPRLFRWRRLRRRRVSRDSPQGESLRFGWGGLSRRGLAPSLTPRLPSHAPPFPQPQSALGGGCREGGSPPDFPSCPAAVPAGTGRFPHSYRNPQSRPVRTHRPSRSSNLCTAEIASFEAADVCEASAECAPAAHGARPEKRETTLVVSLFFGKRAPPGNGPSSVSGTARQRVISQECPPARSGACPRGASWRAPCRSPPPQCGS